MKTSENRDAAIHRTCKTPPGAPTPKLTLPPERIFEKALFERFLNDRILRDPEISPSDPERGLLEEVFYRQLETMDVLIAVMTPDADQ